MAKRRARVAVAAAVVVAAAGHRPPEDTAPEAGTPQGEAQAGDDGDEEGLLTHSEEELEHSQDTGAEDGALQ